ncbi:MAG: hypothetical protein AW08_03335 [Candidatus Accumulibacter adjunctus]|uniref:Uncharacterized protein n=1 Tax=Candidatus Accumulibacter adjunctus TaxID=1454001 RepID=A0A011NKX9_9PROT|nr:MAG: hypothetical protein AW08_03335 [Candidatus Accumulibacter adjunctus]
MQPPLSLGDREFIVRLREVVHADEDVARCGHLLDGKRQDLQTAVGRRHVRFEDAPLRLEEARQMGIVVDRDAVRAGVDDAFERAAKAGDGLPRQAVDQIDADRLEATGARRIDHRTGFRLALQPIHRLLHAGIEILHADAHAIEAEFAEQGDGRLVHLARIDLDRVLATLDQPEVPAGRGHQLAHLVMRQEGRCAAAPVQLRHLLVAALEAAALQCQFARQVFQVLGGAAMVLGDDLVAGAVVADGVAERDVEVQ